MKVAKVRGSIQQRAIHAAGVGVLVFVGVKVTAHVIGNLGRILFPRKKAIGDKPVSFVAGTSAVSSKPSEDSWHVLTASAPALPSDLKQIFTCELGCSVQDFYRWFLSGTSDFPKKLHAQLEGRHDYSLGPWQAAPEGEVAPGSPCNPNDASVLAPSGRSPLDYVLGAGPGSGGFIRSNAFVQPKKGAQNVDAQVVQRQQLCVYQGDVLLLATAQNMLNIPFKDCFTVNTCWLVRPAPSGTGCTFTTYLKVNFIKGCIVGGIIKMTTINSNIAYFKSYAEAASKVIEAGGSAPVLQPSLSPGAAMRKTTTTTTTVGSAPSDAPATMSLQRQLRVALLFMLLMACIVHQLLLKAEITEVRGLLATALSSPNNIDR